MSTRKETADFIIEKLELSTGARGRGRFSARAMFGEYALYADKKVVGLVCDDLFYVKILPATITLEGLCEKGEPYPRAKLCYIVEEGQLDSIEDLAGMLFDAAESIPEKSKKKKKQAKKK